MALHSAIEVVYKNHIKKELLLLKSDSDLLGALPHRPEATVARILESNISVKACDVKI